ncbi:MAG: AMP-binding protein [Dehalococcoidia bacterium]
MTVEGFPGYRKEDAERYSKFRWWRGMTLGDMLDRAADVYPDKEAVVEGNARWTYSQIREKADKLAIALMKLGINKEDRVLLQIPNWSEFIYSYFALHKIGAIDVLLVPRHAQTEIGHLARLTEATAWIVPERYHKIEYVPMIDSILAANPGLKHIVMVRGKGNDRFHSLEKLIEGIDLNEDNLRQLAERRPEPTDVAHMGPTGGTTGLPKVAPRTHNDVICNVEYKAYGWERCLHDVCLPTTPLGHDMTYTLGFCGTIFTFGKMVLIDSTQPEDMCKTVQSEKVNCAVMAPALAARLVNFEGLKNYDMSSLTKAYVGGAPSSPDLIRAGYEKVGYKHLNGFGGTEGHSMMTRLDYDIDDLCNAAGKPTCPYEIYKIIDPNGEELPINRDGELVCKGPGIFSGYFKADEENSKAFTEDGFFMTGDMARIDDQGRIKITGRIKDIILRGGESISPAEIEDLIAAHSDVEAVAVIGMPDEELGERICAYVQLCAGAKLQAEDIHSFLKDKGASLLQRPERIEFIDAIPLTKVGKADKNALRDDIKNRLGVA